MFELPNFEFDEGYAGGTITDEEQVAEIVDTINEILEETEDFSSTIITPAKNYDGEVGMTSETSCSFDTTDGSMTVSIWYETDPETGKEIVMYSAELYQ